MIRNSKEKDRGTGDLSVPNGRLKQPRINLGTADNTDCKHFKMEFFSVAGLDPALKKTSQKS